MTVRKQRSQAAIKVKGAMGVLPSVKALAKRSGAQDILVSGPNQHPQQTVYIEYRTEDAARRSAQLIRDIIQ